MSILEIIATISTILCVWYTAKEDILCWPIGIISVLSLIGVYVQNHIYIQILLQLVFLVQCIIGWYNWGKKDDLVITWLPRSTFIANTIFFIGLGSIFALFTTKENYWFGMFDGISAFLALLGNWYLTKKIMQAWPLFMSYNVIIAILLFSQGIYLLAGLNICLFFISLNGLSSWKRNLREG